MDHRYLDHRYQLAGFHVDPVMGYLDRGSERCSLARRQLEVLAMLASGGGETVPREAFIDKVWDGNALVGQRALTDTIYELRRLLEDSSSKSSIIRTVPRHGYRLLADVRLLDDERSSTFHEGWAVPGRKDIRLVRLLSQNPVSETWLAAASDSGTRRVFRFCRNEAHLQRLRREILVLRFLREKLANRSDVLSIIDWRLDEPPYFLEMDPAVHGSLHEWAVSRGGLEQIPLTERVDLIVQAASALDAVHAAGVVHRNLSPASLFIDEHDGELVAKLGEFGLGDLTDRADLEAMAISTAGLTLTADGSGRRPVYLAPDGEAGQAADVYALGVVLYQVVVGDFQRTLADQPLEAVEGSALRELLADCLHARPERRPSASELRRRLAQLDVAQLDVEQHPVAAGRAQPAGAAKPGRPAVSAMAANRRSRALVGESVGPFRVLDVLGEGGMGTVYLAEQRQPVERKVALKLIRAGMDSDQVLARFEAERQALALMAHANVASVYDAGCSASGHPYFAMEYVPGLEITDHCDRSKLGVRARVELFLQVCDGVQHAHQKGLIHRDLKPSNLLVKSPPGQAATVKIIDFGVAKSLQRKLTAHTVHTRSGTFVGTPSYSSPEQIAGHLVEVDIRADIYSLGIVLYELLTGVTPYSSDELAGKSPVELVRLLGEGEPPTPLARLSDLSREDGEAIAKNRSQSIERLKQRLRSDVAWIIVKCLERDPDDRYGSVPELKKDLERWLHDRPIEARPATRTYRLRKLIKRHRTAVVLATLTTLALVAATTAAVFGLVRAEREAAKAQAAAREAEAAADFQVNQLQSLDPAAMAQGLRSRLSTSLRQKMAESGVQAQAIEETDQQLDRVLQWVNLVDLILDLLDGHFFEPAIQVVEEDYGDYPELQARLWQSIADTLVALGHLQRAEAAQDLALARRRSVLGPEHPLTLESTLQRGDLLERQGHLEEARADFEAALDGLRRHFGDSDERTLEAREDLGEIFLHLYLWEEARGHLTDVLAERRRILGNEHPETLTTLENLGTLKYWTRDLVSAERFYDEALAGMRRVFGENHPLTLGVLANISGVYFEQGKIELAIAIQQEAIEGMRATQGNNNHHTLTAINDLAVMLAKIKDHEQAELYFREALNAERRSVGLESVSTMTTAANLARTLLATGRLDEAEELLRPAVDLFRRVLGPEHRRTQFFLFRLGILYRDIGRLAEAEAAFRELASSQAGDDAMEHPRALYALNELAHVLLLKGQIEQADELHRRVLEKQRVTLGQEHGDVLRSQTHLAMVLARQGKLAEAEAMLRQTLALQRKDPGLESEETLLTLGRLAALLRQRGHLEEALALGEEAARVAAAFFHENDHRLALIELSYGRTLTELGRSQEAEPILRKPAGH